MRLMRIESDVPFGKALFGWLCLHHTHCVNIVSHDHIEKQYLAWETVRLQTNPYFLNGTGFEGYFVGLCHTPEAALEAILATSQGILDAIARLYRYDFDVRKRLIPTLLRESGNPKLIHLWSAYLGATLGKLRCQLSTSKEAVLFQTRTYRIVGCLPPIAYHEIEHDVTQTYIVGAEDYNQVSKFYVTPSSLKPCQQDAWLVAAHIGEFGHPMVRRFLDRA
jgi:hypothetical protein